ncbi:MAG TPA: hypothetical protein VHU85_05835 [Acidimicrobiales bacterium]|jgi:hypothetical protein|nr:hypothetical protein [Acidimicrobiales bacterium]
MIGRLIEEQAGGALVRKDGQLGARELPRGERRGVLLGQLGVQPERCEGGAGRGLLKVGQLTDPVDERAVAGQGLTRLPELDYRSSGSHATPALRQREVAAEGTEQRGLAAPVRAADDYAFAVGDGEVERSE